MSEYRFRLAETNSWYEIIVFYNNSLSEAIFSILWFDNLFYVVQLNSDILLRLTTTEHDDALHKSAHWLADKTGPKKNQNNFFLKKRIRLCVRYIMQYT